MLEKADRSAVSGREEHYIHVCTGVDGIGCVREGSEE